MGGRGGQCGDCREATAPNAGEREACALRPPEDFQGGLIRFDTVATPPVSQRTISPRRARIFCMAASNQFQQLSPGYQGKIRDTCSLGDNRSNNFGGGSLTGAGSIRPARSMVAICKASVKLRSRSRVSCAPHQPGAAFRPRLIIFQAARMRLGGKPTDLARVVQLSSGAAR
jgi:hypothetical protein